LTSSSSRVPDDYSLNCFLLSNSETISNGLLTFYDPLNLCPSPKKFGGDGRRFRVPLSQINGQNGFDDRLFVLKLHPGYFHNSSSMKHAKKGLSIKEFELTAKSHCFISLLQINRKHLRCISSYLYSDSRLIVVRLTADLSGFEEIVASQYSSQQALRLELVLAAGRYAVVGWVDWKAQSYDF